MPPHIAQKSDVVVEKKEMARESATLQLNDLRKAIPEAAFEKSLFKSTFFMLFDYSMWLGSVYAIYLLNNSPMWQTLPFWQQAIATIAYWSVAGFFMWCLFVIGHDCGHTNFSNYALLNDIVGHITHGSLLVPYYPWQMTHRRHHMYHNHVHKDYSHPWYTEEVSQQPKEAMGALYDVSFLRFFSPIVGWFLYLFGLPDGSHFIPFPSQRMWKECEGNMEAIKCIISSTVVLAYVTAIFHVCGYNLTTFGYYYGAPLVVFGWWLTTVTYLQHHAPDTVVYDDSNWRFVDAAFETVDRKFGFGIDYLSHHITDGHVAHHLFFTKIPHYNLPLATKAIREYMVANNLSSFYKYEETYDFAYRVHKYFVEWGYKATLAKGSSSCSVGKKSDDEAKKVK